MIMYFLFKLEKLEQPIKKIQYESMSNRLTNLTCTVSDGKTVTSSIIAILFTNINEAPAFDKAVYNISRDEGSVGSNFFL